MALIMALFCVGHSWARVQRHFRIMVLRIVVKKKPLVNIYDRILWLYYSKIINSFDDYFVKLQKVFCLEHMIGWMFNSDWIRSI